MSHADLQQEIFRNLPYLRRYARALTGSQKTGDSYAVATMEALIAAPDEVNAATAKIDLFRAFHSIWASSGQPVAERSANAGLKESRALERLSGLMPNTREALLLNYVEGFTTTDIAKIIGVDVPEAAELISTAVKDMRDMVNGDVMIIEDEAIIAMDLAGIVRSMGHTVTGIARTETGAIELGARKFPDLILADIQLADGSSGIDAVNALLAKHGECPVIFITAFPERLLTGDRPEPAFLITKPFSEDQIYAAVSQAMFFSTTEDMNAA